MNLAFQEFLFSVIQFSIKKILKNKFKNRFSKSKTGFRFSNRKSDFQFSINIPSLALIISIKDLFSSTFFNTSSFVLCFVQLILSILLHIHISKASIRLTSSFLIIHVSVPYSLCFLNLLPS